uniref:TPR-like protein n=1 Tax=Mycena chlorophos TaxID=658473 RepID=A0ABQ0LXZ8_MYCCL|nr:predicted protein [Mycena chlorophos]
MPANTVAALKQQGNTLFSQREYTRAADTYTAAIRLFHSQTPNACDVGSAGAKKLALLFANRSACSLALERYLNAVSDSEQATILDPTNAKAFARLAAAQHVLGRYSEAAAAWRQASASIDASVGDAQKAEYEAGLAASLAKLHSAAVPVPRLPWEVAAMMIPALSAQRTISKEHTFSSAWVIHGAHEEFANGLNKLSILQEDHTGELFGMLGCIIALSNGLLRDRRVMQPYPQFAKLKQQLLFECDAFYARDWITKEPTPEEVVQEVVEKGSNATRAASFIVRLWIIQGQIALAQTNSPDAAIANCEKCLYVLRRLRNSAAAECGTLRVAFLEDTFFFGVQAMYLDMLIQKHKALPNLPLPPVLEQEADALLAALDAHGPLPNSNPGFTSSFLVYPRGMAHAAKGLIASRILTDPQRFQHTAASYLSAADCFAPDDEKHTYHLHLALVNLRQATPFPAHELLRVMARMCDAAPRARAIWEHLPVNLKGAPGLCSQGPGNMIEAMMLEEKEIRRMLDEGELGEMLGEDSEATPEPEAMEGVVSA